MADDLQNRTEEPTPKRREDARAEGRAPQSIEVTAAAVLMAALLMTARRGHDTVGALQEMMRDALLAATAVDLTPAQALETLRRIGSEGFVVTLPIWIATALVALAATTAQVGFRVVPKRIVPDLSKLSPVAGFGRIFSRHGLVQLIKSVAKIVLVGWVTWKLVRGAEDRIVALAGAEPRDILGIAGGELARIVAWVLGVLSVLAALDFAWQWREHQQGLRMSKTEVKDERRQSEGDPRIRSRVRRAYEQLVRGRMLEEVATADVVITNPIHLAVALRYTQGEMAAPRVVAKGAELMAERIKDIARRHGVPIVERRALARALFRSVRVGREIPGPLYRAVAEILAYIYGLRQRRVG